MDPALWVRTLLAGDIHRGAGLAACAHAHALPRAEGEGGEGASAPALTCRLGADGGSRRRRWRWIGSETETEESRRQHGQGARAARSGEDRQCGRGGEATERQTPAVGWQRNRVPASAFQPSQVGRADSNLGLESG